MKRWPLSHQEQGVALLSVLLLVAVMAIITTLVLDRVNLAVRLAGNAQAVDRMRFAALGAERFAANEIKRQLDRSPARTVDVGGWLNNPIVIPVDDGSGALASARIRDAGNCFNLNSVVEGEGESLSARPVGMAQFAALMTALGTAPDQARGVAESLADWIDTDQSPLALGAEDSYYQRLAQPYRTSGQLMVDTGELLAVRGMTAQLYARLLPWMCTLPAAVLSPINVNTLYPEQAPLLVMLSPQIIDLRRARNLIASRPALGFSRITQFWRPLALQSLTVGPEIETQTQLVTRWFEVDLDISDGERRYHQASLIDAQMTPARVMRRKIGEP